MTVAPDADAGASRPGSEPRTPGSTNPPGPPVSSLGPLPPGAVPLVLALALALMAAGRGAVTGPEPGPTPPVLRVDPSTASPALLSALPRLGPSLVGRILAARQAGPFRSAEDLDRRVSGIGPKTIAALRPYLLLPPTDLDLAPDR